MDDNKTIIWGLVIIAVVCGLLAVAGVRCDNNDVVNKENHNTCVVECSKLHQPAECNDACTY